MKYFIFVTLLFGCAFYDGARENHCDTVEMPDFLQGYNFPPRSKTCFHSGGDQDRFYKVEIVVPAVIFDDLFKENTFIYFNEDGTLRSIYLSRPHILGNKFFNIGLICRTSNGYRIPFNTGRCQ